MSGVYHVLDLVLRNLDGVSRVVIESRIGRSSRINDLVYLVLHNIEGTTHHAGVNKRSDFIGHPILESDLLNIHEVSKGFISEDIGSVNTFKLQSSGSICVSVHLDKVGGVNFRRS